VSTNSVQGRRQRERVSGGGRPLVRGSGGSCNLVQEISFHISAQLCQNSEFRGGGLNTPNPLSVRHCDALPNASQCPTFKVSLLPSDLCVQILKYLFWINLWVHYLQELQNNIKVEGLC
jgi:hypothetical protein